MAAEVTRPTRGDTRNRLPQTPRATSSRRGSHGVATRQRRAQTQRDVSPGTLGLHITPNAVVVSRGDIRVAGRARINHKTARVNALDMRRLRT